MRNKHRYILGLVILSCVLAPTTYAGDRKTQVYITGGGDKPIVLKGRYKDVTILPKDGGKFKPPKKYWAPPGKYDLPDRYKAPEGKYKLPDKYKYKKPAYNQ